jgi:hypothetical protein
MESMGNSIPTDPDVITIRPVASSRLSAIRLPAEKYFVVLIIVSCPNTLVNYRDGILNSTFRPEIHNKIAGALNAIRLQARWTQSYRNIRTGENIFF